MSETSKPKEESQLNVHLCSHSFASPPPKSACMQPTPADADNNSQVPVTGNGPRPACRAAKRYNLHRGATHVPPVQLLLLQPRRPLTGQTSAPLPQVHDVLALQRKAVDAEQLALVERLQRTSNNN